MTSIQPPRKLKQPLTFRFADWAGLPLSERVRRTRDVLRQLWDPGDDLKAQLYHTLVTRQSFGEEHLDTFSHRLTMMGCACLERLLTYQPRPSVCKSVEQTQVHGAPPVKPRLFRSTFVIEARHPEKGDRLFGNTIAMAAYPDQAESLVVLLGVLQLPSGGTQSLVAMWKRPPDDGEEEIEDELYRPWDMPPNTVKLSFADSTSLQGRPVLFQSDDPPADYDQWFNQAKRFALVFGLLLDAENSPLSCRDERSPMPKKQPGGKQAPAASWLIRHVYLSDAAIAQARSQGAPSAAATAANKDRDLAAVVVKGHLKRQRFGVGREGVKWIYVSGYAAHRWVATNPTRVVVGTKGDKD